MRRLSRAARRGRRLRRRDGSRREHAGGTLVGFPTLLKRVDLGLTLCFEGREVGPSTFRLGAQCSDILRGIFDGLLQVHDLLLQLLALLRKRS